MRMRASFTPSIRGAGRPVLLVALTAVLALGGTGSPAAITESSARTASVARPVFHGAGTSEGPEAMKPVASLSGSTAVSSSRSLMFGAWVRPRGYETHQQAVTNLERQIGRRMAIDHVYHGWDGPLIGAYERWSSARGHTLLINWKAAHENASGRSVGSGAGYVRWADIASGRYDRDIVARAREVRRFKKTIYIAFHHEPENDRDKPGMVKAGTYTDYRRAWRHIRRVFASQRVRNARFVLILMGWTFRTGQAGMWYPGSSAIDVVGADAYNWFGTAHPGWRSWTTFQSAFDSAHRFAANKRKPLWVGETGTMEDPSRPGRKGEWYRAIESQARAWGNLEAVVFYMGGTYGWYADSTGRSLRGFRWLARSPLFGRRSA